MRVPQRDAAHSSCQLRDQPLVHIAILLCYNCADSAAQLCQFPRAHAVQSKPYATPNVKSQRDEKEELLSVSSQCRACVVNGWPILVQICQGCKARSLNADIKLYMYPSVNSMTIFRHDNTMPEHQASLVCPLAFLHKYHNAVHCYSFVLPLGISTQTT